MTRKRTSLYTALTVAVMSTFLLMSYAVLQYIPWSGPGSVILTRAPNLTTTTWGVFDPETGQITYGVETTVKRPIASITKLFTAYGVLKTESTSDSTIINWHDLDTEGRSGRLSHGSRFTLGELLFPLLIESSNDAGAAMGRALGARLTDAIDELIRERALTNTTIVEPTGLNAANVSTVEDLAHFYAIIKAEYPYLLDITRLGHYVGPMGGLMNNDPVSELDSFQGGKHGYTPEAGRTFVGTLTTKDGASEIGIVLLGSTDLRGDVSELLEAFD